ASFPGEQFIGSTPRAEPTTVFRCTSLLRMADPVAPAFRTIAGFCRPEPGSSGHFCRPRPTSSGPTTALARWRSGRESHAGCEPLPHPIRPPCSIDLSDLQATTSSRLEVKEARMRMTIGEVARRAGIRPSSLRYYEEVGVLPPVRRVNGRRRYDPVVVRMLDVLRVEQEAGFTMDEIRTLFHGFGAGMPLPERWRSLAVAKLRELDELIARAEGMRRAIERGLGCGCV